MRFRFILSTMTVRLAPDLKFNARLSVVELDHMRWTWLASFDTVRCLIRANSSLKSTKPPVRLSNQDESPNHASNLVLINAFWKPVSRSWTNSLPFPDRTVSIAVTTDHAVFEDVLCPHQNALQNLINDGVESKTSLGKSCYHTQREAYGIDTPVRLYHWAFVAQPDRNDRLLEKAFVRNNLRETLAYHDGAFEHCALAMTRCLLCKTA
ncbi:hypothetical protein IAQ61_006242, partial [Plenodomus lingam]|uniref:uncharacterized protein n=1 Tax=Leptosphaeria maculans TaxID=5022 RepID=UPI003317EC69